jgi:diaminopimelate decarboxylase
VVNFSVLYALKSFESFHIFRVINKVGCQLVSKM